MISCKNDLLDWIKYEEGKYGNPGIKAIVFPVKERDHIWKFQWVLRHAEYYTNCGHKFRSAFFKLWHSRLSVKYCFHIPLNTCDRGLKIMHTGPILINWKARVGCDASLHINTSIVAHGYSGGVPKCGNNVVVGVGAVLLGDITIANNIAIGANALVNKSFHEENIAIAGVPARKISDNGRLTWQQEKRKGLSKSFEVVQQ